MELIVKFLYLIAAGLSIYIIYSIIRSRKFGKFSRGDAIAILAIIISIILATSIPPIVLVVKSINNSLKPTATIAPTIALTVPTEKIVTPPPVVSIPISEDYSAVEPGPGCDKKGAIWIPQGLDSISCGTNLHINASQARGYLYFQLPNNKAFSTNNIISIKADATGADCIGLQEQNSDTGYLVEYCGDGKWSINSINSDGAILQAMTHNVTATSTSQTISLKLEGQNVTFSIGIDATDVHEITIPSIINPTRIAISYYQSGPYGGSMGINNFSYTPIK